MLMTAITMTLSVFLLAVFWLSTTRAEIEDRHAKICSVLGGLDATRLVSSKTRNFFLGSIDDVELIREYVTESMYNGGIQGGMHDMDKMLGTLDWNARNMSSTTSTMDAGLAWTDDRADRRIERYIGLANDPLIGNKSADIAMADTVSNIFPWIVDRKSVENLWWLDHQNGRSEGPEKEEFRFDQLYVAAWLGTFGEAWMYYPPLRVFGHPFVFSEVLGDAYDSHEEEFVQPNLPEFNPERRAFFTKPYPDTAQPGLSLITAMAPIYYTGQWQGYTYDDTYMASTGVDIAVSAVSTLLDELDGTMTKGSFAFLVDRDFNMVVISQPTVQRIYPSRTGMEESRVTHDLTDGSIIADRRNQTYLASDTILQSPLNLTNADWKALHNEVLSLSPGDRGYLMLDVVLTGDANATSFYAMYERWPDVADWILVALAPTDEVDNAMNPRFTEPEIDLQVMTGATVEGEAVFMNDGILDLSFTIETCSEWLQLETQTDEPQVLPAGKNKTLKFHANADALDPGTASCLLKMNVQDDQYPDCFYDRVITFEVKVKVVQEMELNQLGSAIYVSVALAGIIICTSLAVIFWVHLRSKTRIVRASQPIFLHMLCVGALFMGVSIIPLALDDSVVSARGCDIACMSFPWLFTIGFCLAFSALFSKIWRINQIFRAAKSFQRIQVSEKDVMIPFVIILSLNVILLLAWTLVSPLKWQRVSTSENSSYGTCYSSPDPTSKGLMIAITVVNFSAVLLANIQAFQARSIGDEFSESSYIGIAMASILQVFLVGIPLLFLTSESPPAFFFVMSSIVFVVAMSLLLLIFVPKILYVINNKDDVRVRKFGSSAGDNSSWMMRMPSDASRTCRTWREHGDGIGLKVTTLQPHDNNEIEVLNLKLQKREGMVQRLRHKLVAQGLDVNLLFREFDLDSVDDSVTGDIDGV